MNNNDIKKSWWKYGDGYHIGDALRLNDNTLRGDTIYYNNSPDAIIISCDKGMFRKTAVLKISDLKTGATGVYHQKGQH
jgi:hypothetical protein